MDIFKCKTNSFFCPQKNHKWTLDNSQKHRLQVTSINTNIHDYSKRILLLFMISTCLTKKITLREFPCWLDLQCLVKSLSTRLLYSHVSTLLGLSNHFFEFVGVRDTGNQLPAATACFRVVNDDTCANKRAWYDVNNLEELLTFTTRITTSWAARAVSASRIAATSAWDLFENSAVKIDHIDVVRHAATAAHHLRVRVVGLNAVLMHLHVSTLPDSFVRTFGSSYYKAIISSCEIKLTK